MPTSPILFVPSRSPAAQWSEPVCGTTAFQRRSAVGILPDFATYWARSLGSASGLVPCGTELQ